MPYPQPTTLDKIGNHAEQLERISESYSNLHKLASQPEASEAFVQLVESIGALTTVQLSELGSILTMFAKLRSTE